MKYKNTLIICALLCAIPVMSQTVYHVHATKGNDAHDGKSWSKALATLQTALDKAQPGDAVYVAAGTYHPTRRIGETLAHNPKQKTTDRHRSFMVRGRIRLYGGFPADATDHTTIKDRDWKMHRTILSGDFNGDDGGDFSNMSENAYHVLVLLDVGSSAEVESSAEIDGFTITGGHANEENGVLIGETPVSSEFGGGIYAYTAYKNLSPQLSNLTIEGNKAVKNGGGMFIYSKNNEASVTIRHSTIRRNQAGGSGGGIFNSGKRVASPELINVSIVGNQAQREGGGFYSLCEDLVSAPHLTNVLVAGNAARNGGGMFCYSYAGNVAPSLTNVTICGNRATAEGGGIACSAGRDWTKIGISLPVFSNTIIWDNQAPHGYPNLYNNGATGSMPTMHESYIEGEPSPFMNKIKTNDFAHIANGFASHVAPGFAPTTEGDYRLNQNSPFIDKGKNIHWSIETDLAGNPRVYGKSIDLGVYEYQGYNPKDAGIIEEDYRIWASHGQVTIQLDRPATIRIYTVEGQLIRQYNDEKQGTKIVNLPNGIYLISLNGEGKAKVIVY